MSANTTLIMDTPNKKEMVEILENELREYKALETKYVHWHASNVEKVKELKGMEYLTGVQATNLAAVIRDSQRTHRKLKLLASNLHEARIVCNRLTLRPERVASADPNKLAARARALQPSLYKASKTESNLAKELVQLRKLRADLEYKYESRLDPTLVRCCENEDWTRLLADRRLGIGQQYEYLIAQWSARGLKHHVSESYVNKLVDAEFNLMNRPDQLSLETLVSHFGGEENGDTVYYTNEENRNRTHFAAELGMMY